MGGGGDYVDCGAGTSLNITSEITLEAWVKTTVATAKTIVAKGDTVLPGTTYGLYILNSTLLFWVMAGGGDNQFVSTGEVTLNEWNHVVITFTPSTNTVKGYINGVFDSQKTDLTGDPVSRPSHPLYIGARTDNGSIGTFFNGTIDEVRIYDAALEASQIKARYAKGLQKLHAEGKLDNKEYYQRLTETGF